MRTKHNLRLRPKSPLYYTWCFRIILIPWCLVLGDETGPDPNSRILGRPVPKQCTSKKTSDSEHSLFSSCISGVMAAAAENVARAVLARLTRVGVVLCACGCPFHP
jgi:hypothetical protein